MRTIHRDLVGRIWSMLIARSGLLCVACPTDTRIYSDDALIAPTRGADLVCYMSPESLLNASFTFNLCAYFFHIMTWFPFLTI